MKAYIIKPWKRKFRIVKKINAIPYNSYIDPDTLDRYARWSWMIYLSKEDATVEANRLNDEYKVYKETDEYKIERIKNSMHCIRSIWYPFWKFKLEKVFDVWIDNKWFAITWIEFRYNREEIWTSWKYHYVREDIPFYVWKNKIPKEIIWRKNMIVWVIEEAINELNTHWPQSLLNSIYAIK